MMILMQTGSHFFIDHGTGVVIVGISIKIDVSLKMMDFVLILMNVYLNDDFIANGQGETCVIGE